jgi:hypothetical protein
MHAETTTKWTDAVIKEIAGLVCDREWKNILNANKYYKMQKVQATSSASTGYIAKSDLNTGTANTVKRFYRILGVIKNDTFYEPAEWSDIPLGEYLGASPHIWYPQDDNIVPLPIEKSAVFDVWVNYIPVSVDALAADSDLIVFPEDYEELLKWETAAWLSTKGDEETQAAITFAAFADRIRADMLQDITRLSTEADRMKFPDSAGEWGG